MGGTPASKQRVASMSIDAGVTELGFAITGHPAANAGAILRAAIAMGKFHGVTITHGPIGSYRSSSFLLGLEEGIIFP